MIRLLLALLVGAATLAGCAAPAAAPSVLPAAPVVGVEVPAVALPKRVTIPAIDASSSLVETGMSPDRILEVPPDTQPLQASWWRGSKRPGEIGPAILLGHVDGRIDGRAGQPGVFHRLRDLKPGDQVLIDRADGTSVAFKVDAVEKHAKSQFPYDRVYGNTNGPALRLITCGGVFDRAARSYEDNIIVWASPA